MLGSALCSNKNLIKSSPYLRLYLETVCKIDHPSSNCKLEFDPFDIKIDGLIVECDGNYWHNFPDGTEKDHRKDTDFKDAGYNILRFWGSEIRENVEDCVNRIVEKMILHGS